jgi:uncharacterized membrane protein
MKMLKGLYLPFVLMVMSVLIAGSALAAAVPATIDSVKIDGFTLSPNDVNVRDLQRGEAFDLKINLEATGDARDVEIRVFITGFEFSRKNPITDATRPFDIEAGVSYVKTLELELPDRIDVDNGEDTYRIRVVVAGRDNDEITENYRIQVTPADTEVIIKDFSITPEDTIQAGRAILSTVRVKNIGDSEEDDVKVRVSIPALGVTSTPDFIDNLDTDESATSEEFFLRIPACTTPGTYDVKAEVTFDQGDEVTTARKQITITPGVCNVQDDKPSVSTANGVTIEYNPNSQDVTAGGDSVAFPVKIVNRGNDAKSYSLSVAGTSDWASVRMSPSNFVTVAGGESQTVNTFISAQSNAKGGHMFIVRVKDQAGNVVKELPMAANVVGSSSNNPGLDTSFVQLLQLGLIALIVVLVVVGLAVAFRKVKGPGGEGDEGTQTYY